MQVRFYATLRPIVGGSEVEVDGNAHTIGEVLDDLVRRFPDLRRWLIADDGSVRPFVAVMVDGRDIRHLDGRETPVDSDSRIDVFPPVAGG